MAGTSWQNLIILAGCGQDLTGDGGGVKFLGVEMFWQGLNFLAEFWNFARDLGGDGARVQFMWELELLGRI